ncbi:MAG: helix-turn-helix domain-containing protein [gamma proteobacterium symbiont of Taylorina sp.]|nr:helix-turn-helix domain-containing protein [gamma proteobacterium symbiont of Taylorina sp.]
MNRTFGTTEFSRLTGISKQTLKRKHESGDLVAKINSKGNRTYCVEDFFNSYVIKHMEYKNLEILSDIKKEYIGEPEKPKLEVVEKKVLPFTAEKKLEQLPSGLITRYLKPLFYMNELARSIWEFTLPDLIRVGYYP